MALPPSRLRMQAINAVAKRYRYTGKERDEESGLYYHGARYYIPWLCRWTAIDPMESSRAGLSPYDYCSDNPINKTDPSGMIDGWVDVGDGSSKVEYNSNIHSQEAASAVYGPNAQYYGESHDSYKGKNGSTYELFADGSFLKDGTSYIATDRASFTDHYFIARAGLRRGTISGMFSLIKFGQADAKTLALSTTTGYAQMGALMGDQNMSDAYEVLSGTAPAFNHHGNGDWAKSYGSASSGGLNRTQTRLLNDMKSWDSYQWSFKTGEFATTTAASYGIGKLVAPMGAGRLVAPIESNPGSRFGMFSGHPKAPTQLLTPTQSMTRVGRWMSEGEYTAMKNGTTILEGAGGQTFVTQGGPHLFPSAAKGSVYAEFEVPTNSLIQGGKEGWFKMLGPNASKSQQYILQKQGGTLLPNYRNLTDILFTK